MSLLATVVDQLVLKYPTFNKDFNNRGFLNGALDTFIKDTPNTLSAEAIARIERESVAGTPVEIPVLDDQTISIINTRTCTIPASESDSKRITVVFATVGFNLSMHPAQYANNYIPYEADFRNKLERRLKALKNALDQTAVTTLENNKTTSFSADVTAIYTPSAGDALQVPQAAKNDMYNQIESILDIQRFETGEIYVVNNPQHSALVRRYANQGDANAVNDSFQFNGYMWEKTNNLANAVGAESTAFTIVPSTLAFLNRNTPDERMRSRINDSQYWTEMYFPIIDRTLGVYYNADCGTVNGIARTKQEYWQITTDVAFVVSDITDPATTPTPITKYEVLA